MLSTKPSGRLSWHIVGRVSPSSVGSSWSTGCRRGLAGGRPRRRAARDQPGDRLQVGPPLSGRGRRPGSRTAAPGRIARRVGGPRGGSDPRRPGRAGATVPTASVRCSAIRSRPSTGPRPARPQPAARYRPGDRRPRSATRPAIPGALVHQDHKKLGPDPRRRRPAGARPGRRAATTTAAAATTTSRCSSTTRSRCAVVVPVADESGASAALALETARRRVRRLGIRIERVLTDNGWAYRSPAYRAVLGDRRRHKRTRPYRPQTNGKAERFIQTLIGVGVRPAVSLERRRSAALPSFVDFYNQRRPHTALGGSHPSAVVNNVLGDHN